MTRLVLLLALAVATGCSAPTQMASWRGAAATAARHAPVGDGRLDARFDGRLDDDDAEDSVGPVGILWGVVMYLPNRVLDVLDIVRARVRLGPGFAIGVRATEYADVFVGTYATVYVGLPGPRGRVLPRLPAGLESKSGAELSVADVTLEAGLGPDYGMTECGLGFQFALVGVDVGVDPLEILDLVVGLFTFDPMDDDF